MNAGLFLALIMLFGRALGFMREIFLAHMFGVSAYADFAVLILALPDLLTNILISGGLSVALIPAIHNRTLNDAKNLFFQASLLIGLCFVIIGAIFLTWPWLLFNLLAPGLVLNDFLGGKFELTLIFGAVIFSAITGVVSATLNAYKRFYMVGCGTIIFNLCVIGFLSVNVSNMTGLEMLAIGVFLGAILRWMSQLISLPKDFLHKYKWVWQLNHQLWRQFLLGTLSTSFLVMIPVFIRSIASLMGVGEIARFSYAMKLVELPAGILVATLSTIAYPHLCLLCGKGLFSEARECLHGYLKQSFLLTLNALLVGLFFSDSIVQLLFAGKKITSSDCEIISQLLRISLLSLPLMGLSALFVVALQAYSRERLVFLVLVFCFLIFPPIFILALSIDSRSILMYSFPIFYLIFTLMTGYFLRLDSLDFRGWFDTGYIFILSRSLLISLALVFIIKIIAIDDVLIQVIAASIIYLAVIFSATQILFSRELK